MLEWICVWLVFALVMHGWMLYELRSFRKWLECEIDGQAMNDSDEFDHLQPIVAVNESDDFVEYKIEYTHEERVRCSDGGEHPMVYYTIPKGGTAQCGYCNRKWIRK